MTAGPPSELPDLLVGCVLHPGATDGSGEAEVAA